jgi:hypothetical protein
MINSLFTTMFIIQTLEIGTLGEELCVVVLWKVGMTNPYFQTFGSDHRFLNTALFLAGRKETPEIVTYQNANITHFHE